MKLEEIVEKLKGALNGAKAKILELSDLLGVLTAQPLVHASVVDVRLPEPPQAAPPEQFILGARVVIVAGRSVDRKYFNTEGTVIEDDVHERSTQHDVRVRCDLEGTEYNFGVGRKHNDGRSTPVELKIPGKLGSVTVVYQNQRMELATPRGKKVNIGDTVALSTKTMQIVEVAKDPAVGETVIVRQVLDSSTSEVDWQGGTRVVVNAPHITAVRKGDRVVLDPSASAVVRNLGKEDERFAFRATTNVTWDDVGGLKEAKQMMVEAVEYPFTERKLYAYYNQPPIKGVLLHGPPRCGKTMLGKAAATATARIHGGDVTKALFLYVKGPEILDKYVGVAEGAVRHLFATLRNHRSEHGIPGVLFIDEADAIMYKRGTGISSDIERTIVPAFLAEMDGLEAAAGLVILATNRPDVLDPAITGDGRMDRRVYVNRPDEATSRLIFDIYFKRARLSPKTTVEKLSELATREMFLSSRVVREVVVKNGSVTTVPLTLATITNGAMIAGIVNQATSNAISRDRVSGGLSGVTEDDVLQAVRDTYVSNLGLNHDDDILDLVERMPQGTRLVGTRRVTTQASV